MKFSVLISVYAQENPVYFNASLQSIYEQTLKPDEVVLVVDGLLSKDLEEVISKWEGKIGSVLKLVKLKSNQGLSAALNAGLAICKNDWIARMDTDDICLPKRLEKQAAYIEDNPDVDVVGSLAIKINQEGERGGLLKVPIDSQRINKYIWACPFIHPSVCYKKNKIMALGGYHPEAGPRQDDYDLWYRCAAAGYSLHNIAEPLILFRFTNKSIQRNTLKVGYYRLKAGLRGNKILGAGVIAYIGVMIPFIRALMPYPLNIWLYKMLNSFNPRTKI